MLAFFGVLILTPDALLVRLIGSDPWTFLFWRGTLTTVGLGLMMLIRFRGKILQRTLAIGATGILISVVFAINAVCFIVALSYTTVANVLLIVSISPLISALIGLVALQERLPLRTWVAIFVAIGGVAIIVEHGISAGTVAGDVAALGTAIGLGVHFNMVRASRPIDMTPAVGLSGIWSAMAGLVGASSLAFAPEQMGLAVVIGLLIMPLSFGLMTIAPKYISAAEVSLMLLMETVLAPIWVWLVLSERPNTQTLIGGAVVLVALIGHGVLSLIGQHRRRRHPIAPIVPI